MSLGKSLSYCEADMSKWFHDFAENGSRRGTKIILVWTYMTQRMNWPKTVPGSYKAMFSLHQYLEHSGIEKDLLNLVYLRASQVNGCVYCIDMHWKDLRAAGVSEQHLYLLNAWRESTEYTERERAALEWTEAVTRLSYEGVSDDTYRVAREQFSETDLVNLTLAVVAINGWNRLNIAFRKEVDGYQPASASKS